MLKEGKAFNSKDALEKLGVDGLGLEKLWRAQEGEGMVKFGGELMKGKGVVGVGGGGGLAQPGASLRQ